VGKGRTEGIIFRSDDEQGIDQGNLEKIFGAFQRLQTKKTPEATGLGLAIVKEITEKHGGIALAECRFGKGVTFYIFQSFSKSL
jgi:light-regulated signal transduction histidine kinase (bacteriophytochrome)